MDSLISKIYLSRSFRRLAGKTQLYSNYNNDHFHNRLTHTLEVKNIAEKIKNRINYSSSGKSIEAIALAHDLGHTPFGHAGERALNDITYQIDDLSGTIVKRYTSKVLFKHNYHSAKSLLSICGYNNSYSNILAGVILHTNLDYKKHPLKTEEKKNTINFYLKGYMYKKQVVKRTLGRKIPIEAQIVALADEIAQRISDLHDLLLSKDYMVTYDDIEEFLPGSIASLLDGYRDSFRIKDVLKFLLDYYVDGVSLGNNGVNMKSGQLKSMETIANKRDAIIHGSSTVSIFDRMADKRVKEMFKKLYKNPYLIDNKMVDSIFERILFVYKEQVKKGKIEFDGFNPRKYQESMRGKCSFLKMIYKFVHSKKSLSVEGPMQNYLKEINSELVYGIVFYIANMTDRFAIEKYSDLKKPVKIYKMLLTKL